MGPSNLSESSLSEHDSSTGSTSSTGNIHSADASSRTAPPSPTPHDLCTILDSSLDEIHIPILQPVLVRHKTKAVDIPPLVLLDDAVDGPATPTLEPERVSSTSTMASLTDSEDAKVAPWDGTIQWALEGCGIFDSKDEELNALTYRPNLLSRQRANEVWIFQYGVRYIPSPKEKNCYRTVRIEGLPANMKLGQVLPSIPGEIYCARLVDTQPIIGSNTAVVTFVWQVEAVRFIQASKDGLDLGLLSATVIPVHTPTYPMPVEMETMIFQYGHTRCLCVSNGRGRVKDSIWRVLMKSRYADLVESIEDGHLKGEVYVRFHSIKTAAVACEFLKAQPGLFQCEFQFLKESCALPPSPVQAASAPEQTESNPRIGIWD